jgi:hypothetical protein
VTEHRLAVLTLHVLAVDDRGAGVLQVLPEQGPVLDEAKPAKVLGAKSGRPCGVAVWDDPSGREGHHSGADCGEVGAPVAAVPAPQADLVAVLQRDDAEAVVLQLVNPAVVRREHGQSGKAMAARFQQARS